MKKKQIYQGVGQKHITKFKKKIYIYIYISSKSGSIFHREKKIKEKKKIFSKNKAIFK